MDRRLFLHRAALIATGAVAANQLELLERLTWKQRFFPGATFAHRPLRFSPGRSIAVLDLDWTATGIELDNYAIEFRQARTITA